MGVGSGRGLGELSGVVGKLRQLPFLSIAESSEGKSVANTQGKVAGVDGGATTRGGAEGSVRVPGS